MVAAFFDLFLMLSGILFGEACHDILSSFLPFFSVHQGIVQVLIAWDSKDTTVLEFLGQRNLRDKHKEATWRSETKELAVSKAGYLQSPTRV
jgi:hypothetical protein